jgi:hypothetical protein
MICFSLFFTFGRSRRTVLTNMGNITFYDETNVVDNLDIELKIGDQYKLLVNK